MTETQVKYLAESIRRTNSCDGKAGPGHIVKLFTFFKDAGLLTTYGTIITDLYGILDQSLVTLFATTGGSNFKFYESYKEMVQLLFPDGMPEQIWKEEVDVKNIKASMPLAPPLISFVSKICFIFSPF